MYLSDLISFRRDLLFQGAVQVGWLETDPERCRKAAEHFVFHGPEYHGLSQADFGDGGAYRLVDTASFTRSLLSHVVGKGQKDNPITLAVAGYGTGKSHLALTLARMLSDPWGEVSAMIAANLSTADRRIGAEVETLRQEIKQPYMVVAINGMLDFDLSVEIIRQVFLRLTEKGIDTNPLEELRPRFQKAQTFTANLFEALRDEFAQEFGLDCRKEDIIALLKQLDEEAFIAVNDIFERKMGQSLQAVAHESLQGFLRVVKQRYCGIGKPFGGIVIFFDEFGRYLEFAAKRPHIAGAGGLQQLFEAVQENSDAILMLCFIQYELKAYASRIAPEARESLEKYLSRYEMAQKIRLSTNLETIMANLIEKKDPRRIKFHIDHIIKNQKPDALMLKLKRWFPDMKNHALWNDTDRFHQVIQKGCWPLHPASTWLLYRLSSSGKSLQQRSAMSFLDDVCQRYESQDIDIRGWSIPPVALCSQDMIDEFLGSEQHGQQGSSARAYENVLAKYEHDFSPAERKQLKSVLLAAKIGLRAKTQSEYQEALAMLSGIMVEIVKPIIDKFTKEKGILQWNESSFQYDILSDAVSVRDFSEYLGRKVKGVGSDKRSQLFAHNMKYWAQWESLKTDFGASNDIDSAEWHFAIRCSDVSLLESHVKNALTDWHKALGVDECRGQLIYCYVGPDSDLPRVRDSVRQCIENGLQKMGLTLSDGAPIAVALLHDHDGSFSESLAEYWVLCEQMQESDGKKYANYIHEHKSKVHTQMLNQFEQLKRNNDVVLACNKRVAGNNLDKILPNLFDVLYRERIPFPFDKFQSARVNAAKDCRLFTTELFRGNLNQSWISVRNAREKNRAVKVLHESWQIFGSDGTVRDKPGNPKVRSIIDSIDSKLREKDSVNLGEIVLTLCRPPYGCNIASAGLILGVFVASHKDRLRFKLRENTVFVDDWLAKSFEREILDLSVLEDTWFRYIPDDRMSKWQVLLNEWEIEKSYEGQFNYLLKGQQLNKEELVPDSLFYRWELLQRTSLDAQKAIGEWQDTVWNQEALMERFSERGEAGQLAKCSAALMKLLRSMNMHADFWTQKQFVIVQTLLSKALKDTREFFADWLRKQLITDPTELSAFRQKLSGISQNLIAVGLQEQAGQLQVYLKQMESEIDRIIKIKGIVGEVRAFVEGHRISDGIRVTEICSCLEAIADLKKTLKDSVGKVELPQLNEALNNLNSLEEKCRERLQAHELRVKALGNGCLGSIQQVEDTAQEVRSLCAIYDGRETELKTFQVMLKFLSLLGRGYDRLASFDLSNDELQNTFMDLLEDAKLMIGENKDIPWNVKETYAWLLSDIESKRKDYALHWMKTNVPRIEDIQVMDAGLVQRLRNNLQSPPVLLSLDQREMVQISLNACVSRLDDMEVEGLLVRFKYLSKEAQLEFLNRAQELVPH